MAIPICKDFCDEALGSLWQDLGVERLLVPSFGDAKTLSAHGRAAETLFRRHAAQTLVANQHPDARQSADGFACGFTGGKQPGKPQPASVTMQIFDISLPCLAADSEPS